MIVGLCASTVQVGSRCRGEWCREEEAIHARQQDWEIPPLLCKDGGRGLVISLVEVGIGQMSTIDKIQ
jgi:hypothetical protein